MTDRTVLNVVSRFKKALEQEGAITRPTPLAEDQQVADAPPGWEGPVKEMKKDKDIDNPWALAWYMKNKGDKPHKKEGSEEGHDVAAIRQFLDMARVEMTNLSKAQHALGQVARWGDHPGAKAFAKEMSDKLYAMSKAIESYLHNNPDLNNPPPKVP